MIGEKFGRITVLRVSPNKGKSRHLRYICSCECNGIEKEFNGNHLRTGNTKSCGCLNKELNIERSTTHGLSSHPLYSKVYDAWKRCNDPKHISYHNYGGRKNNPIKFKFNSIPEAIVWIEENLGLCPEGMELDRKENDGNYEPGNLKWSDRSEQGLNRRLSPKKTSKFRGVIWDKSKNKWMASIWLNNKNNFLGRFDNEQDAAEAFLEKYYAQYKKFPPEYKPMKINQRRIYDKRT